MQKAKIERSTGIPIVIGGVYYGSCGNGYEGKTKELDAVVQKEAQILVELFGKDVEIRFNSDRQSGGAWIKNNDGNTQVGLGAGLRVITPNNVTIHEYLKMKGVDSALSYEADKLIEELPKEIVIDTGIEVDVLKDGKEKEYPEKDFDGKNYWRHGDSVFMDHTSLENAVTWLKNNVNPKKIKVVKQLLKGGKNKRT